MNAKPHRNLTGFTADLEGEYHGELRTVPAQKGTVIFECKIQQPPSSKGRTIYVWFQDEDLTDALKVMRDAAIEARR